MPRMGTVVRFVIVIATIMLITGVSSHVAAEPVTVPRVTVNVDTGDEPEDVASTLQLLALLTLLSLAPAILIMMTSFTRIIVILSFVRTALAMQQMPPNQVLVGLALFLTTFVMAPVLNDVNDQALQPFLAGEISQSAALDVAAEPLRAFMLRQTREKDLGLFVALSGMEAPETADDVPTYLLIPAFAISELKTAFEIGFLIFIPFIIVDMIVASTLMSMGMLMLPPMMISLPFKILLFVLVDGWYMVIRSVVSSFH